jgi:DNA-binding MarR family transcriptional regulator
MSQSKSSREAVARELMFVSGYVHRLLRNEARGLGLRWTAVMVLKDLQLLGPSSQRTLADVEQVSAPTMTVLLQQMEEQRWIQREDHRDDARVSRVSITPEGRKELKRAGGLLRQRLEQELRELPAAVLAKFQPGMEALSAAIMRKIHGSPAES